MTPGCVLVPLEESGSGLAALPIARALADLSGTTLRLLYVGEPARSKPDLLAFLGLRSEDLAGAVLEQRPGIRAHAIAREAEERKSAYVVMTCPPDAPARPESIVAHVMDRVACPLVLVPPGFDSKGWAPRRILLPHDGSPTTAAAIGPVSELALEAHAELFVLHVAPRAGKAEHEHGALQPPRYLDQPHHEWPAWADEFLERLGCLGCLPESLVVRLFLAPGDPGEEIVHFAQREQMDLVVLAWRGHLDPLHARTLKSVIQRAPCPVLVLRTQGAPRERDFQVHGAERRG